MEAVAKSEIFFLITSISVVVLTILLVWALVYVLRVLRDVKDISNTVKSETQAFSEDLRDLRTNIRSQGFAFRHVKKFFTSARDRKKGRTSETNS